MRTALFTLAAILISVLAFAASSESPLVPALGLFATAGLDPKVLREKRGEFLDKAKKIIDRAYDEKRDLTEAENAEFDELIADADQCEKAVDAKYAHAVEFANRDGRFAAHARRADLSKIAGSAAPAMPRGNDSPPAGRVMFRDDGGRDVRAYAHNEPMTEGEPLDIGRMLYAQLTGRFDMLQPHELKNLGANSGDGYLLTPHYSQNIIDLARSASVAMRAGAMTVNMPGETLNLVRLLTDPVSHWRHPGNPVTATDMVFGMLTLTSKTLASIVPIYLEWLEDARNGAQVITNAIQNAMALKLDQAALFGLGAAAEPRGILNEPSVNAVTGVGTPTNYAEVSQAVGDILNANYPGDVSGLAWVKHPRDGETYDNLLDTDNNPLRMTPWAEQLQKFHTTSLPTTDGGGGNESSMIVGDFKQVIFGIRRRMNVRVLDSGSVTDSAGVTHNAANELKRLIVVYMRADVGVLRPTWLTKLTGVTA